MEIPKFGIGTYKLTSEQAYNSVVESIRRGFRHFDTASLYKNEEAVGSAINFMISEGVVSRSDIFVTTKVWIREMKKGPDTIKESVRNSLNKLNVGYIDLVLLHGPVRIAESWRTLEELDVDIIKKIGVSNFNIEELTLLLKNCRIVPYTNQIELSIFMQRGSLIDFCNTNGIIVTAHTFLGRGDVLADRTILELGKKYGSTIRVLVNYVRAKKYVVLFRSKNKYHIEELEREISDPVILGEEDLLLLDNIHKTVSKTYFINYSEN